MEEELLYPQEWQCCMVLLETQGPHLCFSSSQ